MQRLSPFTLIVTFVCLALVGLALVPMLPVKLNPSRTLPGFTVRFSMPGTSSRVVEMEATSKLESMLARIKGVKAMYSTSGNGYGSITVDLDKHADVDAVRFEASTIIRQTWSQFPSGVSYPYIDMKVPDENASRPFLSFTLNAPSTPILIQQYAEEHIKPRLAQLQGIYKIDLSGATMTVNNYGPWVSVSQISVRPSSYTIIRSFWVRTTWIRPKANNGYAWCWCRMESVGGSILRISL